MTKVLVLGANGMLGIALSQTLRSSGIEVVEATSAGSNGARKFKFGLDSVESVLAGLGPGDYVLNAIGLIGHRIDDSLASSRMDAILVNALLPCELGIAANRRQIRVIQIATDCVFSGETGLYSESSPHDPLDVYGKSKSLGEVPIESVMHIRCSIIGPEHGRNLSLLEWLRGQDLNAQIRGYADHLWNGVTTHAFAKVIVGVVRQGLFKAGVQHLVPSTTASKYELLKLLASRTGRNDIEVSRWVTGEAVNRTLSTNNPGANESLWLAAGYETVPSIAQLIEEMPIN